MRWSGMTVLLLGVTSAATGSEPGAVELDTMQVTAGRTAADASKVPQGVSVVSRDEIERQPAPHVVTEFLRGETGVFLQSSGPGQGIAIVRGLKGSEVLHLVDGMRLNMALFRNSPNQYLALVDPYNVERVELLRGPASTLYGSDAMGGVVQVLTPEHRFAVGDVTGGVLGQYASGDLSRTGRAWVAAGGSAASVALGATYADAGGVETGQGPRTAESQTGHIARGYDGKVLWNLGAAHELMLSASEMEYPELPRFHEITPQPNGGPQRLEATFRPNRRDFVHFRYRLVEPAGLLDGAELHLARQVIDDDRTRVPTSGARRELESNRSTLDGATLQGRSVLGSTVEVTYGAEHYFDSIDSSKQCEPLTSGCNASHVIPFYNDGAEQRSTGVYLSSAWQALSPWRLEAGVRYSRVRTRLQPSPLNAAATLDDDDVTGSVGSAFTFAPGWVWTATVARGFRAPNVFDVGTLGPSGPNVYVPNPDLEPETLVGADTGLKADLERFGGELMFFATEYDDRIKQDQPAGAPGSIPDTQFGCDNGGAACDPVHSENLAEAKYWGIEAGLWCQPLESLRLYTHLNVTRGTERAAGAPETPANRVPPVNGRAGALWRLGTFSVEPFVLYAGEQRRLDPTDEADVRIAPGGTPGWATVNLRLAWDPLEHLGLRLEGGNLLDASYREHGSGIDGTGASVTLVVEARL